LSNVKKRIKIFLVISGTVLLSFLILFFSNKEFRFNIAVRFIVLTNVDPFHERYYDVNCFEF